MSIKNNLKVQGQEERTTTFCYRGLYDEQLESNNKYNDNDVVKKDGVFVKYNNEADPKWQSFDIDEEILNTQYESSDSLYFQLLNNSINTSLAVSTPLMKFLNDYSSTGGEISENTTSNDVKKFLNNSLTNLIWYNILNQYNIYSQTNNSNKILADFYTQYINQNEITFIAQYNVITNNTYMPDEDYFRLNIPDDSLKFDNTDDKIRIKHFNNYGKKDSQYTSPISDWGKSTYFNSYAVDKYGHIKNMYSKLFTIPKKPYFEFGGYDYKIDLRNTSFFNFKSTSNINKFINIARSMYLNEGYPGAILEFIFLPESSDYNITPTEVKISLDSTQFKYNEKAYVTPFLCYKLTSESISSGYGTATTYNLEIWFTKFSYKLDGFYDIPSHFCLDYTRLYEVRLKYLTR